jgi:cell division septation protein DedD
MMARTLTPEPMFPDARGESDAAAGTETDEFELVVGRRQIAGLAFVSLVILAVCAGGSYLIGKGVAGASASDLPAAGAAVPAPEAPAMPVAASVPEEAPAAPPLAPDKPLYANPIKGIIYIQMGAVEKGISEILAEGLRRRGFDSFVAPGPTDRIFRVLIGPFHSADEYQAAKNVLDRMGLETFARRYQE